MSAANSEMSMHMLHPKREMNLYTHIGIKISQIKRFSRGYL